MNRFLSAVVLLVGLASADHHGHHHVSSSSSYSSVQANPGATVVAAADNNAAAPSSFSAADIPAIAANIVAGVEKKLEAEEKADSNNGKIDRSDTGYAAPSAGVAAATAAAAQSQPVSTGNLYYYYYPVAAYPLYDNQHQQPHNRVQQTSYSSNSASSYQEESSFSPLLFLLVPLVLLLLAVPFLSLLGVNVTGSRNFQTDSFARTVDDLLAKYVEALDSDECMDRIFCELGVKAQNIHNIVPFLRAAEWVTSYQNIDIGVLKRAATKEFTMDTCKSQFVCYPPKVLTEALSHLDWSAAKKV